jgi:hypothetical protein
VLSDGQEVERLTGLRGLGLGGGVKHLRAAFVCGAVDVNLRGDSGGHNLMWHQPWTEEVRSRFFAVYAVVPSC